MSTVEKGAATIHYELSGVEEGEAIVLCNSLGSNLGMWDRIVPALERNYRVLRYDMRGHGESGIPKGPYSLGQLGEEALLVLDQAGIERAYFCGLSLGGLVAMWTGIHAPNRVRKMVLANTASRIGTLEMWDERIRTVERFGMEPLGKSTPERWFTASYRDRNPVEMERIGSMVASTDAKGYAACCGVLRDTDLTEQLSAVGAPCLVIAGTHDPATPPSDGRALHNALRDSSYVELDASHLSAWERPAEFSEAVLRFVERGRPANG